MMGVTHVAVGLTVAVLTGHTAPATVVGIVVGSLLPDIDSPKSTLGRLVPVIPYLIKHRTITHSIWFALLVGFLWWPLGVGSGLHLVLDWPTKDSISPFWPFEIKFCLPSWLSRFIKTGGLVDGALCGICWGYLILTGAKYFGV